MIQSIPQSPKYAYIIGILCIIGSLYGCVGDRNYSPIVNYRSVTCDEALCDKKFLIDDNTIDDLLTCFSQPSNPGVWGRRTPQAIKEYCDTSGPCTIPVGSDISQPMESECTCVDDFGYPDPPRSSCCIFPSQPTNTADWQEAGQTLADKILAACDIEISVDFQPERDCRLNEEDEDNNPAAWAPETCEDKGTGE